MNKIIVFCFCVFVFFVFAFSLLWKLKTENQITSEACLDYDRVLLKTKI